MDIPEKLNLIHELIDNVKMDIIKVVRDMPEEWDGIELRWLIAEKFAMEVGTRFKDKRSRRYQDYRDFIITKGGNF